MATDTPQRKKYDSTLLSECILRDNAKLVGEYPSPNATTPINFICPCGKEDTKKFRGLYEKGGAFCKACASIRGQGKAKASYKAKTGFENPFVNPEVRAAIKKNYHSLTKEEKQKRFDKGQITMSKKSDEEKQARLNKMKTTLLKNYPEGFKSKAIKDKKEKTLMKNYGVKSPMKSKDIRERAENTNLKKYNVKNVFQNKKIKEKIRKTLLRKYKVDNPMKLKEIREKGKRTNLTKCGKEYPAQCLTIEQKNQSNNKRKITCFKRYKVGNPMQNKTIFSKMLKKSYSRNEYILPSGKKIIIQGYERFAILDLLKIATEEDILNSEEIEPIDYILDGKERKYFPDFKIKSMNKIIEIKGDWTIKIKPEQIKAKGDACKALGYAYEIWVYNSKGEKIDTIVY